MRRNFTRVPIEDIQFYIRLEPGEYNLATHFSLVPTTDIGFKEGWEDVVYLKEPVMDASGGVRATEYVYVLVNKSMPGMVKIGLTTTSVDQRVKEINGATGVPTPWIDVFKFKCYGSKYLEREVHQYLAAYRVSSNREMFAVTTIHAQEVIEKLGDPYTSFLYVDQKNLEIDLEN
jgi:hypothetical protein